MTIYHSVRHRNPFVRQSSLMEVIDTFPGTMKEWARYTAFTRRAVTQEIQQGRCYLCGFRLSPDRLLPGDPNATTDDHVLPKSLGGGWPWNLLLAHRHCNQRRGNEPPRPCELLLLASVNWELRWRIAED